MARYTGPKNKLSRREGVDLFGKGIKLRRLNVPPGVHGPKMRGKKLSEFGMQLREKQKLRRAYGLLERQFSKYVAQALKSKGSTAQVLITLLESRLDNVVFRAGLTPTRAMARQLVVHGHVMVNGSRVDKPSYHVQIGEQIMLGSKAAAMPVVQKLEASELQIPSWLNKKATVAVKNREITMEDFTEQITLPLIVEYYSR